MQVTEAAGMARTTPAREARAELLNEAQAAALLGVSQRKFAELRVAAAWLPAPVVLGPRALRWPRAELLQAVAERGPRLEKGVEPEHLRRARIERMKAGAR